MSVRGAGVSVWQSSEECDLQGNMYVEDSRTSKKISDFVVTESCRTEYIRPVMSFRKCIVYSDYVSSYWS